MGAHRVQTHDLGTMNTELYRWHLRAGKNISFPRKLNSNKPNFTQFRMFCFKHKKGKISLKISKITLQNFACNELPRFRFSPCMQHIVLGLGLRHEGPKIVKIGQINTVSSFSLFNDSLDDCRSLNHAKQLLALFQWSHFGSLHDFT